MAEYLTREEFKATREMMGYSFADEDIQLALAAASEGLDQACGRRFDGDAADAIRYYTPSSSDLIVIDDLNDFTTLGTDQDGDGTFEQAWTENADFNLEPLNAAAEGWPWTRIRVHPLANQSFPYWYPRSVKLTGKFGWATVPQPIKEATSLLAGRLLKQAREAPLGIVSIGIDIGATARLAVQDPSVKFLITPYIRERPQ